MAAKSRSRSDGAAPLRSDAYVGILFVSLIAQIIGVVFFFLDWSQYPDKKPPTLPAISAPAPQPVTPGGPGG
jgi:hypothetical protein